MPHSFDKSKRPNLLGSLIEGLEYVQSLEAEIVRLADESEHNPLALLVSDIEDMRDLPADKRPQRAVDLYKNARNLQRLLDEHLIDIMEIGLGFTREDARQAVSNRNAPPPVTPPR